jgi:uncharacterized protein YjbJ (UPF0337 family)
MAMIIDKNKITTQDELNEPAPIDQVEDRVEAEMKKLEGKAKKDVGDGLMDRDLARKGEQLEQEGEREMEEAKRD